MQFDFAAERLGEPFKRLLPMLMTGWLRRRHCY
jgi:hypothetical protein